jgi:uncharacterized protein
LTSLQEKVSSFDMFSQLVQSLITIFLGIFIEAVPFLLAGAVVSGLISEYVRPTWLQRVAPRRPLVAALTGVVLGMAFPVCECGVVPVTRRLYKKGLPMSTGVAFLLAAPVLNPIVIASTLSAYGWSPMFWGRMGAALVISVIVGVLFHLADPGIMLRADPPTHNDDAIGASCPAVVVATSAHRYRFWHAMSSAGDEFLEMAQFLTIGCLLAAGMQVLMPQSTLMAWGTHPVYSVVAMMALAFVLSICSTVDAFVSLAFVTTFMPGAVFAFLVFGPMVDIKNLVLFRQVFRPRAVAYLVILPLLLTAVFAIAQNVWGA